MPLSFRGLRLAGKARNRRRHRKAAFVLIPHRQAAFRTDHPLAELFQKEEPAVLVV